MSVLLYAESSADVVMCGSALGKAKGNGLDAVESAVSALSQDWKSGGCVDEYMQDQLIVYMALAHGTSQIVTGPLSLHTQTAIHFAQLLTGAKFTVTSLSSPEAKAETKIESKSEFESWSSRDQDSEERDVDSSNSRLTAKLKSKLKVSSSSSSSSSSDGGKGKGKDKGKGTGKAGKKAAHVSFGPEKYLITCEGIGFKNKYDI